jgi:hypothetical protein
VPLVNGGYKCCCVMYSAVFNVVLGMVCILVLHTLVSGAVFVVVYHNKAMNFHSTMFVKHFIEHKNVKIHLHLNSL